MKDNGGGEQHPLKLSAEMISCVVRFAFSLLLPCLSNAVTVAFQRKSLSYEIRSLFLILIDCSQRGQSTVIITDPYPDIPRGNGSCQVQFAIARPDFPIDPPWPQPKLTNATPTDRHGHLLSRAQPLPTNTPVSGLIYVLASTRIHSIPT